MVGRNRLHTNTEFGEINTGSKHTFPAAEFVLGSDTKRASKPNSLVHNSFQWSLRIDRERLMDLGLLEAPALADFTLRIAK